MISLVREAKKSIQKEESRDAGLIAVALRMAHCEMAGYFRVCTYAFLLGDDEASDTLQMTLDEEAEMECGLTGMAEKLSADAEVVFSRR